MATLHVLWLYYVCLVFRKPVLRLHMLCVADRAAVGPDGRGVGGADCQRP